MGGYIMTMTYFFHISDVIKNPFEQALYSFMGQFGFFKFSIDDDDGIMNFFSQISGEPMTREEFKVDSDTYNEILKLEKLYDQQFPPRNEWVSVSERMPEHGQEVLVWVDGHRGSSFSNNYPLVCYYGRDNKWWEACHPNAGEVVGVIKWQLITKPNGDIHI